MGRLGPHVLALKSPHFTLLVWGISILLAGYQLASLQLRTDGSELIPRSAPEVCYDAAARKLFGLRDKIIVVVEPKVPGGVFQKDALALVAQLTEEFRKLPGVGPDDVVSLATEKSGSVLTGPIQFPSLLDPPPRTDGEVEQARADATTMKIYAGTLLSRERETAGRVWPYRATAILIGIPDSAHRKQLAEEVSRIARNATSDNYGVFVVGGPIAESLLGDYVLNDLRRLLPVTILIVSTLLYWLFRSVRCVIVVIAEIGACLVVTFGIMACAGVPVTITMIVLPLVVIPIIVADEVHIFTELHHQSQSSAIDLTTALRKAFDASWIPVAKTGLTTALSGLVFAVSPVPAIREFGLFLSVASLTSLLWTLTASPVLLSMGGGDKMIWGRQTRFHAPEFLIRWVTRRPGTVLAIIFGLPVIPVAIGLSQLTVQDSWTSGFSRNSDFRRSMERIDKMFDGTQLLYLIFDTRPGALLGRSELSELSSPQKATPFGPGKLFELRLMNPEHSDPHSYVGKNAIVRSIVKGSQSDTNRSIRTVPEQIRSAHVISAERGDGEFILELYCPDAACIEETTGYLHQQWSSFVSGERILDPEVLTSLAEFESFLATTLGAGGGGVLGAYEQIATTRFMLFGRTDSERRHGYSANENADLIHLLEAVRGHKRLREMIDAENQQVVVTMFLKNANYLNVGALLKNIGDYEQTFLTPRGIRIGYAGDVLLSQSIIKAITHTELWSIVGSLGAMCLLISFMERSAWIGILSSIPSALSILVNLSLMGILGTPIGVATSMFASITFGIGVDSSIHFFERLRGTDAFGPQAVADALSRVYGAIAIEALVLVCGFGILAASSVPANRALGLFLALTFFCCSFLTVCLLPAACCMLGKHGVNVSSGSNQHGLL